MKDDIDSIIRESIDSFEHEPKMVIVSTPGQPNPIYQMYLDSMNYGTGAISVSSAGDIEHVPHEIMFKSNTIIYDDIETKYLDMLGQKDIHPQEQIKRTKNWFRQFEKKKF